jgi:hypothetical protein
MCECTRTKCIGDLAILRQEVKTFLRANCSRPHQFDHFLRSVRAVHCPGDGCHQIFISGISGHTCDTCEMSWCGMCAGAIISDGTVQCFGCAEN